LRIAQFFIANLGEDRIPRWDFRAPEEKDPVWDSSAGACAASGMLELSLLTPGQESAALRQTATEMVQALDTKCGAWDTDDEGLLHFGTGNKPANDNVHVSLIYGDYFFVEALAKLRGQTDTWW
jgi:unsaturated chondroitin disaccharide hydrolase